MSASRILIAEDEESLRQLLTLWLDTKGLSLELVPDGEQAMRRLEQHAYDLIVTDLRMPRMSGMELLRAARERWPESPVIVMTGHGTIESAVEAMQYGAIDYITKPFEREKLKLSIDRGLRTSRLMAENRVLRREMNGRWNLGNIITRSPKMQEAIGMARRVAQSNANVIVYGESGTGKELITRGIHTDGPRAVGPFVAINCAAIPDDLLEAELFGHEKGAFTGAYERKAGKFELANGGTLFLDEIADISTSMQAKTLRAIENREIQRVGGSETINVDVRFIAATNKDLKHLVSQGSFREDLFFRLNVFPVVLPPLRERPEDIVPLAEHFAARFCEQMGKRMPSIPDVTREVLLSDPWPGNVRELQNTVERAVILLQGDELTPDLIRKTTFDGRSEPAPTAAPRETVGNGHCAPSFRIPDQGFSMEDHEKMLLMQALQRTRGKKAAAARLLGITRKTLEYRVRKFDLDAETLDDG